MKGQDNGVHSRFSSSEVKGAELRWMAGREQGALLGSERYGEGSAVVGGLTRVLVKVVRAKKIEEGTISQITWGPGQCY